MKFYEIILRSVPRIKFACAVSVNRYKNQFSCIDDFLEIAVNTGGDICIAHRNDTKEWSRAGMITPVTQEMNCRMFAEEGICQSHVTVGVDVKYECTLHDTDNMDNSAIKNRVYNEGAILLPYLFPLDESYEDCVKLIRTIIAGNTEQTRKNSCEVLAAWFRLAGKLTDIVVNEIEEKDERMSPYSSRYFEAAKKYIAENYARRLSVDDVAVHTGISSGYLQLIFKKHVSMGVTEYINYHKIQLAKQYIQGRGLSLREISFQLGFDDPAYMSRLFKKTEGISYREYCQKYLKS
jgi:AraC-like DNA-binding protein